MTKDERIERDWVDVIIKHRARVILLTDSQGGITELAAALICARDACERTLLDNPMGPLIIRVNKTGTISKIRGETELRSRRDKLLTTNIVRAKRLGVAIPDATYGKK